MDDSWRHYANLSVKETSHKWTGSIWSYMTPSWRPPTVLSSCYLPCYKESVDWQVSSLPSWFVVLRVRMQSTQLRWDSSLCAVWMGKERDVLIKNSPLLNMGLQVNGWGFMGHKPSYQPEEEPEDELSFAHSFLDPHSLCHSKYKRLPLCYCPTYSLCYNEIENVTCSGISNENTRIAIPPSRNNPLLYDTLIFFLHEHTFPLTRLTLYIMLSCAYKVSYFYFFTKII